ncbi:MAG: tRNA (cytidine(34)-2'-O)-methyltransferase, partial [Stellaceae bacterium]
MRIALYEPDIPQNTGTILRLAACLGLAVDIIEPAGFPVTDRAFRRAGMDYAEMAEVRRWLDFPSLLADARESRARIMLLTSGGDITLPDARFRSDDIMLLGSESSGVPA